MTILASILAISVLTTGCAINIGTQKVEVREKYPVYPVAPQPVLENLTAQDNDPHLDAASIAKKAMDDGAVTDEERGAFAKAMDAAEKARWAAIAKKAENDRRLIWWGRKNQATMESYNQYAAERNEAFEAASR